jgi:nicotinate-nucleotide--dimethylbenzimidazole phosphoribosyltransferase
VSSEAVEHLLARLPSPDEVARAAVRERASCVLRPAGALAGLDELAGWLAAWQGTDRPGVRRPVALVFAADHGVTAEGVSAYPASVTAAMLAALRSGAATACALSASAGVRLEVVDLGVGAPTGNIAVEDALTPERWSASFEAGRTTVRDLDADLLVLGEMGIGNTTVAAAICSAVFGGDAELWTGSGTGVAGERFARKLRIVDRARRRVEDEHSPIQLLRRVGGSELAAIAGAAVEARLRSIPVLLDGYVVTAAVAPLEVASPGALAHCWAAHRSTEPGHSRLMERLGMTPILDLEMRLGEASGALLAVPIVRAAAAAVVEVATFAEWGLAPT